MQNKCKTNTTNAANSGRAGGANAGPGPTNAGPGRAQAQPMQTNATNANQGGLPWVVQDCGHSPHRSISLHMLRIAEIYQTWFVSCSTIIVSWTGPLKRCLHMIDSWTRKPEPMQPMQTKVGYRGWYRIVATPWIPPLMPTHSMGRLIPG